MTATINTPTILLYTSAWVLARAEANVLRDNPHIDNGLAISTVCRERSSSAARGRQESVGVASSTSDSGGIHSSLGGRTAECSSGRGEEGMPFGKIVRLEKYGLGFVESQDTGKQYPFRFDQVVGFKGEPLNEMEVRVGSRVSFELQNGRISEIHPRKQD